MTTAIHRQVAAVADLAPAFDPERDRPLAGQLARYLASGR
jgi:hypothetical protein